MSKLTQFKCQKWQLSKKYKCHFRAVKNDSFLFSNMTVLKILIWQFKTVIFDYLNSFQLSSLTAVKVSKIFWKILKICLFCQNPWFFNSRFYLIWMMRFNSGGFLVNLTKKSSLNHQKLMWLGFSMKVLKLLTPTSFPHIYKSEIYQENKFPHHTLCIKRTKFTHSTLYF